MKKFRYEEAFELTPADNDRLAILCGQFDENLRQIERHLGVEINNRAHAFQVIGPKHSVEKARQFLLSLYERAITKKNIVTEEVALLLQAVALPEDDLPLLDMESLVISTSHLQVKPRNVNQYHYLKNIQSHEINFGIGPSGTGKTYLAVACAVAALVADEVQRIILVRPAVEAGEKLGFLPGDLSQKVDPYLRPLYDALYEMLGVDKVEKLISKGAIEVAPLAYMRGRTLNDAFVILDEGQNTTKEQMKMFLTRMGFGSKVLITGDITQIDLPKKEASGLRHVIKVLREVPEIHFTFFKARDVVRHPLVQLIVQAYERFSE
jgi:phosphate starvation-inducible PhoH-like protein